MSLLLQKTFFWALVSKKENISLYGNVKKAPKNQVAQQGTSRHCEGYSNPRIRYIKEGICPIDAHINQVSSWVRVAMEKECKNPKRQERKLVKEEEALGRM